VNGRVRRAGAAGAGERQAGQHPSHHVVRTGAPQSEDRHEAVAQHLLDLALVLVHDRHQLVHQGTHDPVHHFRIDRLDQPGKAADVRE
jgi:hypothetical protein